MSLFEYTKWDGSQQFQPQSADKRFDQLAEYMLQYGDQVLRNLDDLDDGRRPNVLELIQKEGLIEKDGEGKWQVTPKGLRRIQESALTQPLPDLPAATRIGKHDTRQKGEGTVRLEDSKPYVYGDSLANLNLHETLKNAMSARAAARRSALSTDDYVVYETEYQTRCADGRPDRHERVDEPVRQVRDDQEGRAGPAGDGPRPVPAGHAPDGRLLHATPT